MISLLMLILASGPTGSLSGGRTPQAVTNTLYVAGTASTVLSITTYADVALQEARWVTQTAGAGGSGDVSISINDDGTPVCTLAVDCDAALDSTASQSCAGVLIIQSSAVTITVDRSACVGAAPAGNLSYVFLR